jgi:hypothetical protein
MTAVDPFQAIEKIFSVGAALGIVQAAAEDEHLDGGISTVDGRRMVNSVPVAVSDSKCTLPSQRPGRSGSPVRHTQFSPR